MAETLSGFLVTLVLIAGGCGLLASIFLAVTER